MTANRELAAYLPWVRREIMHIVTDASYVDGHKIQVCFEDGSCKLVDLAPHLDGPVFEPLKDVAYFRRFTVNHDIDTVVWPNDADFSPDFLYEIGEEVTARTAQGERPRPEQRRRNAV